MKPQGLVIQDGTQLQRYRKMCTFLGIDYSSLSKHLQMTMAHLFDNVRIAGLMFSPQEPGCDKLKLMVIELLKKHRVALSCDMIDFCMREIGCLMSAYVRHLRSDNRGSQGFPTDYVACSYIPLVLVEGLSLPLMFIVVDDAQDLSQCEINLFFSLAQHRRAHIRFCGSRQQRIYGFRGAMDDYCSQIPPESVYSLTTSFRSNDVICNTVRERFGFTGDMIYAASTTPPGDACSVQRIPSTFVRLYLLAAQKRYSSVCLMAYKNDDVARWCATLIGSRCIDIFYHCSQKYSGSDILRRVQGCVQRGVSCAVGVKDKFLSLVTTHLFQNFELLPTVSGQDLSGSQNQCIVTFSTIHKFKGREVDIAFVLTGPWTQNIREDREYGRALSRSSLSSDQALEYVALTRARHHVYEVFIDI